MIVAYRANPRIRSSLTLSDMYLVLYADTAFNRRKFLEQLSNHSVLVVHARHVQRSVLVYLHTHTYVAEKTEV